MKDRIKIFCGTDMFILESQINNWLDSNDIIVKYISQTQEPECFIVISIIYINN